MKLGKLIYKCRNCGEKFDNGLRGRFDMMQMNFIALIYIGEAPDKDFSGMLNSHSCKDETTGIADLIALEQMD